MGQTEHTSSSSSCATTPQPHTQTNSTLPLMYKKGTCTLPVFAQPTNKYWTDQLKPLRGPEENISEQQDFGVEREAGDRRWKMRGEMKRRGSRTHQRPRSNLSQHLFPSLLPHTPLGLSDTKILYHITLSYILHIVMS